MSTSPSSLVERARSGKPIGVGITGLAGKAVLCEWPLRNGLAEAEELARRAGDRGVRTAVGLQARSHPVLTHARDLVADGHAGEVLSTTVGSGGAWAPPATTTCSTPATARPC